MPGGKRSISKPRAPGSLKEAQAQLVVAIGGQTRAAELCRVSRSQVARYTDDSDESIAVHMPADVIACLEQHAAEPIVTRYLASLTGHALLTLADDATRATYPQLLSRIGKETGQMFGEAAAALADGRLAPKERGRVRREAVELMTAISALVADIDHGDDR
jgi:regulatory protein CII